MRRIRYFPANQPPVARISISSVLGSPLSVRFDGSGSTDDNPGDSLTYQRDFTDNGTWDSTEMVVTHAYPATGRYTARLRVTDTAGESGDAVVDVLPQDAPHVAVIDTPGAGLKWAVGDTVSFTGHGTDEETGQLPAAKLRWQLRIRHCEIADACHTHVIRSWDGVASGSFVAPDHEFPSYLELALTATDPAGQPNTVVRRLDPKTVKISMGSSTPGVQINAGSHSAVAPYTIEVIQGSSVTISAPRSHYVGATRFAFFFWSDWGYQTHVVKASRDAQYDALYFKCWGPAKFLRPEYCADWRSPSVRQHTPYRIDASTSGRLPVN